MVTEPEDRHSGWFVSRTDRKHLSVTLIWVWLRLTSKYPSTQNSGTTHRHKGSPQLHDVKHAWFIDFMEDVALQPLAQLETFCVSHDKTVWASWWGKLKTPRCHFMCKMWLKELVKVRRETWRDWSCNIDSGRWRHLGQFISAKQIISPPRGKPKTQNYEDGDQIYPGQLKHPIKWCSQEIFITTPKYC